MSITVVFRPTIEVIEDGRVTTLRVAHQAVFANYLTIKKRLAEIPTDREVVVDLAKTRLVDHTVLEKMHALEAEWSRAGRRLRIAGLEEHSRASKHPLSMARRAA
jgi:MFS superfamily sulfate permease-like transporter